MCRIPGMKVKTHRLYTVSVFVLTKRSYSARLEIMLVFTLTASKRSSKLLMVPGRGSRVST